MSRSQWDVMKKPRMYFSKHTLQICASGDPSPHPDERPGPRSPQLGACLSNFYSESPIAVINVVGGNAPPCAQHSWPAPKTGYGGAEGAHLAGLLPFSSRTTSAPFPSFPSRSTHARAIPLVHSPFLLQYHTYLLQVGLTLSTNSFLLASHSPKVEQTK